MIAAALLAACAPVREKPAEPAVPRITEEQLRDKARDSLEQGLRQYQNGSYGEAQASLNAALDHGLLSKNEQSTARKHLAFIHCVGGRESACRDEFRKALEIDPKFTLGAAEAGHPLWGPVYRGLRAELSAPPAPPAKPLLRSAGERLLGDGMAKYDAGEFDAAVNLLQDALKEGLGAKADRLKAHKHSAFSLCLLQRYAACRGEFAKLFEIDPDFDLAPEEVGHPSWRRTYAAAKQRAKAARDGDGKK